MVGLTPVRRAGDEWAEFDAGPVRLALHGRDPRSPEGAPPSSASRTWMQARRRLEQRGARFDEHVGEVEGFARFATFRDPDGNALQIIEYRHA